MTAKRRRPLLRAGLIGVGAGVAVSLGQNLLVQGLDALLPSSRMSRRRALSAASARACVLFGR